MNKKLYFKLICILCIFISLLYYDYSLCNHLKREQIILDNINCERKNQKNKNNKIIKTSYNFMLKKIYDLENMNFNIVDLNIKNKVIDVKLCYNGSIDKFNKDDKIKNFFLKNKEFNINSVILNENKVILNMNCSEDLK